MNGIHLISSNLVAWISRNPILLLLLSIAVVVRIGILEFIALDDWINLKIYRSAGALVVEGINPYALGSGVLSENANSIRTDPVYFDPHSSQLTNWSGYVSSNPPLSTLLWGGLEFMAQIFGAKLAFHYAFSFVDFVLFTLGVYLVREINGVVKTKQLIAVAGLTILNPLLIWFGTVLAEDKQIQTVLVLCLVLLLVQQKANFFLLGLVSATLILFKVVGFPLLLVVAWRLLGSRKPWSFIQATIGATIPVVISLLFFGWDFIQLNLNRLSQQGASSADHDSLYVLAPDAAQERLWFVSVFVIAGVLLSRYLGPLEHRLILLSLWLSVAFAMLYLVNGAWDRQMMALLPILVFLVATRERLSNAVSLAFVGVWMAYLVPTVTYYLVTEFGVAILAPFAYDWIEPYAGPIASLVAVFSLVAIFLFSTLTNKGDRSGKASGRV
jgi:hypothetical protein